MDAIRVGAVGCGGIFRNLHTPYYEMTERARIVAACDVVPERAEETAARFSATACTDYRELLERDDIDAIDLATHPRPHCEIAVAAAQAGKHVFVEKPMCRTVAEADLMLEAAATANVALQVAYMMPFNPAYAKLRELLRNGTLGDMHLAYCHQVGWFKPAHPWLFVREESGGMLVEQAIHNLDIWLWLYGAVDSVYAQTSHVPLGGTYPNAKAAVENNAVLTARFRNGGTGMLIKSWAAELGTGADGVVCANGSATVSQGLLTWKTHDMTEPAEFRPTVPDDDTYRSVAEQARKRRYWAYAAKGASIEHWLKCIAGEETPTTSGQVGRAGIEIAEAAYRSADNGVPVQLPL